MINGQPAYDRIIDRLKSLNRKIVARGPNQAMASCPGPIHKRGDRNPSLSISRSRDRVLVNCLSGDDKTDVVAAIGWEMRDLFDNRKGVTYPYADGRIIRRYWDQKEDKKGFKAEGVKNPTTVLYTMPPYTIDDVKAAGAQGKTIFLCEGEDDVDAIMTLCPGEFAVSAPHGANSFHLVDAEPLHGLQVIAIVDDDEKGEQVWTPQVLAKLRGKSGSLDFGKARVGKDGSDHVNAGYPLDKLVPWRPPADQEQDYAEILAFDVEREAHRIRVREAAQRKIRNEQQRDFGDLEPVSLADFLAIPDKPIAYRIDSLWPIGGRVVLAAQWKAGKTTMVGNVLRSLADGGRFLDRFETTPARVTLLDFEMDERKIRQWLRDQGITDTGNVQVIPLRGKVSSFDVLDPVIRSEWAARLRGSDIAIFDCLRPILDALGLDENRDAGRLLMAIDELLNEAGVPEALIVHHMGHSGERSRGDSRIIDWPDATWKLVRENPDDEKSPRYFSAYGRDVYQPESLLAYHPDTRRLTIRSGNRRDTANEKLMKPICELLLANPDGMSGRQIDDAMGEAGYGRNESRNARAYAIKQGYVRTHPGKNRAAIHKYNPVSAPVRHSAPGEVAH